MTDTGTATARRGVSSLAFRRPTDRASKRVLEGLETGLSTQKGTSGSETLDPDYRRTSMVGRRRGSGGPPPPTVRRF